MVAYCMVIVRYSTFLIFSMKYLVIFFNVCFLIALPFAINLALFYTVMVSYIAHILPQFATLVKDGAGMYAHILYYDILLFPVLIVLSNVISWIFFARRKYSISFYIALLPFISIAIFFIIISLPVT